MLKPQLVYLAQSDTTAGFLSQNPHALAKAKKRSSMQPFLCCVSSMRELKNFARVPKSFKNQVRRSKKTTFIYPNSTAVRVVKEQKHLEFLQRFSWMYSSSANQTKKGFEEYYAKQKADIIVKDERGFYETSPSSILRLGRKKRRKIR